MVLLPWLAVILANDRPPKMKAERLEDAKRHQRQPSALLAEQTRTDLLHEEVAAGTPGATEALHHLTIGRSAEQIW